MRNITTHSISAAISGAISIMLSITIVVTDTPVLICQGNQVIHFFLFKGSNEFVEEYFA